MHIYHQQSIPLESIYNVRGKFKKQVTPATDNVRIQKCTFFNIAQQMLM